MLPADILKKVRRIEIRTNRLVNESLAGEYHSVFKGRGMEFSEVREYQFGDDIRSIDWNVTSRMGHPYVKKHVEERELTVILLVDFSASGDFGTRRQFKREIEAEICAILAFSAIKNSDRVGLIAFTDRIETFLRPRKGKEHVLRVIREILYFRDFNSGAMIENVVARAKKEAIKRFLAIGEKGIREEDLADAIRAEFRENEDLPNTTNPDDWARISGKKGERIVYVRTLLSDGKAPGKSIENITTGQYL